MAALAALSKYQGRYNEWKEIKAAYGLKWKINDDIQTFENMTQSAYLEDMLAWVRDASTAAPAYRDALCYDCLTGLRPAEAYLSLELPNEGYYNQENGMLEHYRFPKLFIRQTKKAYVSVVTPDILHIRKRFKVAELGYNALRLTLQRHKIPMNMNYCRKIHGTFLKKQGIDAEIVDLLQGRLPKSVFMRHYYRPNFKDEIGKVRALLNKLYMELR